MIKLFPKFILVFALLAMAPILATAQDEYMHLYQAEKYAEALPFMIKAADAGDKRAQFYLGKMYENARGVEHSYKKALKYYKMAAKQKVVRAAYRAGLLYSKYTNIKHNFTKAARWWKMAADWGHTDAQIELGVLYLRGDGVSIPNDYKKAIQYFQMAAELGSDAAPFWLGLMYEKGYGVEQNYATAFDYFKMADEEGYGAASKHLGDLYYWGWGVPRHCSKAMFYYHKATELGNAEAVEPLRELFYNGCRIYEVHAFPMNWITIPVYTWANPSPELAVKMKSNETFKYINDSQYTQWLLASEDRYLEKGKRTEHVAIIRKGSYTKYSHTPITGYSAWWPSNFKLTKLASIPFRRYIKMEFFFDEGTTLAEFTLPFQFRTSLSPTNQIEFTVYNDATIGLKTTDSTGIDITHFRSKKEIRVNGPTTIEYWISWLGEWMILVNDSLLANGAFNAQRVRRGSSNKFWFEGSTNIVSLTLTEMVAPENYEYAYGLAKSDLDTIDNYLIKSFNDYVGDYHLVYHPPIDSSTKDFSPDYYNTEGWQIEGHERIFVRRMDVDAEKGSYTGYRIGLIVTGTNGKGQSISLPFQYEMIIDELNKTITNMKLYFNSKERTKNISGKELEKILANELRTHLQLSPKSLTSEVVSREVSGLPIEEIYNQ